MVVIKKKEGLEEFQRKQKVKVEKRRSESKLRKEKRRADNVVSKLERRGDITPEQAEEFRGGKPVFEGEKLTGFEVTRQKIIEQQASPVRAEKIKGGEGLFLEIGDKELSREVLVQRGSQFKSTGFIVPKRRSEDIGRGEAVFVELKETGKVGEEILVQRGGEFKSTGMIISKEVKESVEGGRKSIIPLQFEKKPETKPSVISAGEKTSKVKSEFGVLAEELKSGFTFSTKQQPRGIEQLETVLTGRSPSGERLNILQVGLRDLAFTTGLVGGLGAQKIGSFFGGVVSKVPPLSKGVTFVGGVLGKKPVVITLGGLALADIGITAFKEGESEAVRRTVNIAKDIGLIGGILKGSKLGQPTNLELDVSTFQDTTVLRGSGIFKGQSIRETTISTDLGKTSISNIQLGKKTFVINRGLKETEIKVFEPRSLRKGDDLRLVKTIREGSEPNFLDTRLDSLIKAKTVRTDVRVETPLSVKLDTTITDVAGLKGEGKGGVSLDLQVKSRAVTTARVTKPVRKVDEFSRVFDLNIGKAGIEKKPLLREIGDVDIVFDKDIKNLDVLKRVSTDKGFIQEFVKAPEVFQKGEQFIIGEGKINIVESVKPLFSGKRAQQNLFDLETVFKPVEVGIPLLKPSDIGKIDFVSGSSLIKSDSRFVPVAGLSGFDSNKLKVNTSDLSVGIGKGVSIGDKSIDLISEGVRIDSNVGFKGESDIVQFVSLKDESSLDAKTILGQDTGLKQDTGLRQETSLFQDTSLSQKQSLRQDFGLRQNLFLRSQDFRLRNLSFISPAIPSLNLPKSSSITSLFDVTVGKQDNKFFFERKGLSLPEAVGFGRRKVKGTAAASFKITPSNGGGGFIPDIGGLGKEFRKSKVEEGVFVQKREFRIGSFGEKQDITLLGLQAIRNKDVKRLF